MVKRFCGPIIGDLPPGSRGDYVRYTDYATLESEASSLRAQLQAAEKREAELTAERDALRKHVADIHNRVRHELYDEIETACGKAFQNMAGILALRDARALSKETDNAA